MKYVLIIFIVTVPLAQPATLVAVNGTKTLLVSAYLEHRSKVKKVSEGSAVYALCLDTPL